MENLTGKIDKVETRLNKIDFEIVDLKITTNEILSIVKDISEKQDKMMSHIDWLVKRSVDSENEDVVLAHRVQSHEDRISLLEEKR